MANNQFASKFGAIAAIAGSAVGLGNIWKFPYVTGQNGGAAFLILYVVISVLIAVPVMLTELAVGRHGRRNAYHSFIAAGGHKAWGIAGWMEILAAMLILSFYSVIAGWSMEYIWQSVAHGFNGLSDEAMSAMFVGFINSWRPVAWTLIFLAINCVILLFGVSRGIENCSKFMIPTLFLILVILAIVSSGQPGWKEGMRFFLKPNWSEVTGRTFLLALGQSFFSLSIGAAALATYGAYIDKNQNLVSTSLISAGATLIVALLSGMVIYPNVFTYGVEVTSGPALVFMTLPPLFAAMPGGRIISVLFFVLLFFAAVTSSISLLEVGTAYITDRRTFFGKKLTRAEALGGLFVVIGMIGVICALSQRTDSPLTVKGQTLFDIIDLLTSSILLPLGGIASCMVVGWVMKRDVVYNNLTSEGRFNSLIVDFFYWLIKWVCPIVITFMFINGIIAHFV